MVCCDSGPSTIGFITLDTKQTGAPSAGNLHAGCDEAGAGRRIYGLDIEALPTETRSNKLGPTLEHRASPRPDQEGYTHLVVLKPRRKPGTGLLNSMPGDAIIRLARRQDRSR